MVDIYAILTACVQSASHALRQGTEVVLARVVHTRHFDRIFPIFNSETYDVYRFRRDATAGEVDYMFHEARPEQQGERAVCYTAAYHHTYVQRLLGRAYIPAFDVLVRHFKVTGSIPLLDSMHYSTTGIEACIIEGPDMWTMNVSLNTTRFDEGRWTCRLRELGYTIAEKDIR